ncbi:MAG TPA: bifunctional metallophosphatase/5'-nucleotidase [Edaphocola sp.]|nr:bifunctional metallophosphatase/5'-nucleotidase [Edaphocola sp.]
MLSLSGCQFYKSINKASEADNIVIKIIQINDVYEIDAINSGKNGGLARVAHISDSIKSNYPNTWFLLAGDFVNPSLLGTIKYEGERLQGRQMIEVLNKSGLDLATFGNHEFDIKEADLQKRMNESYFKWTSANVQHVYSDGKQMPFYKINNHDTIPVSDFEIYKASNASGQSVNFGVISVTIPSNPKDFVHYGDIYEDAERAYNLAASKSEFVLGLTHVSIEQDKEIARKLPNIPLIMGGHEHNNMKHTVGKTVITKADANVVSLYLHTLNYNVKNKSLKINSQLIKVNDSYPANPEVQKVVNKWNQVLDENLKTLIDNPNQIVYQAKTPLDGTDEASRSVQTNLGGIICRSMSFAYNDMVDGAITNGGGIRIDDKLSGSISAKDIFRILPFGGQVLLVEMKGKLLKEVLAFGVKAVGNGAYLQRDNIDQNKKGQWVINGNVILDNRVYKIAINDFLLTGLDIPFLKKDAPGIIKIHTPNETDMAGDLRKSIIHYLKAGKS